VSSTLHLPEQKVVRSKITINGIVQGVGFRPYIYNLAKSHYLKGYVLNNPNGVHIEAEGVPGDIESFLEDIPKKLPPQANIVNLHEERLLPCYFTDFEIRERSWVVRSSTRAGTRPKNRR